jgi:hypothetical protein
LPIADCRLAVEKVVFEFPALSMGPPRRVNREPEVRNVEEESEIWNLKSEGNPWAFSDQQEHLYVVTES